MNRRITGQFHFHGPLRPIQFNIAEIGSIILGHFSCSQEFRIEISGRKPEPPPLIFLKNPLISAFGLFRAHHAGRAVIVSGHGQGPASQFSVVLF